MRINNDIRNYVSTRVREKAEAKRKELFDAQQQARDKRDALEGKVKAFAEKLVADANEKVLSFAKGIGVKLNPGKKWNVVRMCDYDFQQAYQSEDAAMIRAKKAIEDFDRHVSRTIEDVVFQLSLGCDYDSAMATIERVRF